MTTITIKKTQSVTDIYMSEELKYYLEREDSDDMEMDNLNIFAFEKL